MAGPQRLRLCHLEQLAPGQSLGFSIKNVGQDDFFLINNGGRIVGYKNSCPHWPGASMPVFKNRYLDSESRYIVCSGHGALFEVDTGACIKGPCAGQRLASINLEITEVGEIFLIED
jgi:nitrite reductase/ring-hydroxylating ferredoxin subunit